MYNTQNFTNRELQMISESIVMMMEELKRTQKIVYTYETNLALENEIHYYKLLNDKICGYMDEN